LSISPEHSVQNYRPRLTTNPCLPALHMTGIGY